MNETVERVRAIVGTSAEEQQWITAVGQGYYPKPLVESVLDKIEALEFAVDQANDRANIEHYWYVQTFDDWTKTACELAEARRLLCEQRRLFWRCLGAITALSVAALVTMAVACW